MGYTTTDTGKKVLIPRLYSRVSPVTMACLSALGNARHFSVEVRTENLLRNIGGNLRHVPISSPACHEFHVLSQISASFAHSWPLRIQWAFHSPTRHRSNLLLEDYPRLIGFLYSIRSSGRTSKLPVPCTRASPSYTSFLRGSGSQSTSALLGNSPNRDSSQSKSDVILWMLCPFLRIA